MSRSTGERPFSDIISDRYKASQEIEQSHLSCNIRSSLNIPCQINSAASSKPP